ncbi:hypothetical protein Tsp_06117 [Trichinella spiralis]|uniref:hypothetical protein n=1 Tax=Trichinella spiralis TaxID=6334 RepID=UPI0001EFB64F|nr:hypothetical protein Tsp_06117 [Trichinella spiralis]
MLFYIYGEWKLADTSDAEDEEVAVPLAPHCFHSNSSTNITSSPALLWSFVCSEHRDKSCSDHFVLNVASVSIDFAPDCSCIVQCTHFIHDSISSDGALTISLSQSSSVHTCPDNVLVLVAVSAFPIYGLRHPMKIVPLATLVQMDIKAFPSRPSVPLIITNRYRHQ